MKPGLPRSGQPRAPAVQQQRERQKRTICRFSCKCGQQLLDVSARALLGQPATYRALVQQSHRKHQAETGCEQEIV